MISCTHCLQSSLQSVADAIFEAELQQHQHLRIPLRGEPGLEVELRNQDWEALPALVFCYICSERIFEEVVGVECSPLQHAAGINQLLDEFCSLRLAVIGCPCQQVLVEVDEVAGKLSGSWLIFEELLLLLNGVSEAEVEPFIHAVRLFLLPLACTLVIGVLQLYRLSFARFLFAFNSHAWKVLAAFWSQASHHLIWCMLAVAAADDDCRLQSERRAPSRPSLVLCASPSSRCFQVCECRMYLLLASAILANVCKRLSILLQEFVQVLPVLFVLLVELLLQHPGCETHPLDIRELTVPRVRLSIFIFLMRTLLQLLVQHLC